MDADHLEQLLFAGEDTAAGGRFSVRGRWTIDGAGTRTETLVAAAHEYMHQVLNEFNVYGQLLHVLGLVSRVPDQRALDVALALLRQCRTAHEAYATFTSVWLSGIPAIRALEDYQGYDVYYQAAAQLTGDLDVATSLAGYHIVEVALSECFNAPLPAALFDAGVVRLRPVDIPRNYRPDRRFEILRARLARHVPDVLRRLDRELARLPAAAGLGPSASWDRTALMGHSDLEENFTAILRAELRDLFRRFDLPTVSNDAEVVAAVEVLKKAMLLDHPHDRRLQEIAQASKEDDWEQVTESVTVGEELVFRRPPRLASVTTDDEKWIAAADEHDAQPLVAVVTSPRRLRKQYEIEPSGWVADSLDERVVWLVDPRPDQTPLQVLWTPNYADLDRVLRRLPGRMISVLIVASTIPDEEWWEDWGERLQERGDVVLYGDTNIVQVIRSARAEAREVAFSALQTTEVEYLNCVVLDAGLAGFPLVWLGSAVARTMLVRLLRETGAHQAADEESLLRDEAVQIALRYIVNHECRTGLFQGDASEDRSH